MSRRTTGGGKRGRDGGRPCFRGNRQEVWFRPAPHAPTLSQPDSASSCPSTTSSSSTPRLSQRATTASSTAPSECDSKCTTTEGEAETDEGETDGASDRHHHHQPVGPSALVQRRRWTAGLREWISRGKGRRCRCMGRREGSRASWGWGWVDVGRRWTQRCWGLTRPRKVDSDEASRDGWGGGGWCGGCSRGEGDSKATEGRSRSPGCGFDEARPVPHPQAQPTRPADQRLGHTPRLHSAEVVRCQCRSNGARVAVAVCRCLVLPEGGGDDVNRVAGASEGRGVRAVRLPDEFKKIK